LPLTKILGNPGVYRCLNCCNKFLLAPVKV
jgi:hypothetical protein